MGRAHRRRRWLALSALSALSAWTAAVLCDPAAASPVAIDWKAPPGCPDASQFVHRVEALSGLSSASWPRGWTIRAHASHDVARVGRPWRLSIEFAGGAGAGRRVVEGESCAAVVEAAALHVALGLERGRGAAGARRRPPASAGSVAVGKQLTPAARAGALFMAASGTGQLGPLPGPGGGGEVAIGFDLGPVIGELRAAAAFSRRSDAPALAGVGARVALYWAEPDVCIAAARTGLRGCAGVQLGWLTGRGVGVEDPRREGSLWIAPDLSLVFGFRLGAQLAIEARALAGVALIRPRFTLESGTLLHRPDRALGQVSLGAAWRFE
jgi:hypothetical protein